MRHLRYVKLRTTGDISVVQIEVTHFHGAHTDEFNDAVGRLVEEGVRKIVLNLAKVHNINSYALGAVLEAHMRLAKNGGRLCVANPTSALRTVFLITRVDRILDVCATEKEAITSFAPPLGYTQRRWSDWVVVLEPTRDLMGRVETEELCELIDAAAAEHHQGVVINMSELHVVTSEATAMLAAARRRAERLGSQLVTCCAARALAERLRSRGLDWPSFTTEEEAVHYCQRK